MTIDLQPDEGERMIALVTGDDPGDKSESTSRPPKAGSPTGEPSKAPAGEDAANALTDSHINPASLQMLLAFSYLGYRVYEGSARPSAVRQRRTRNKQARISRRINRG